MRHRVKRSLRRQLGCSSCLPHALQLRHGAAWRSLTAGIVWCSQAACAAEQKKLTLQRGVVGVQLVGPALQHHRGHHCSSARATQAQQSEESGQQPWEYTLRSRTDRRLQAFLCSPPTQRLQTTPAPPVSPPQPTKPWAHIPPDPPPKATKLGQGSLTRGADVARHVDLVGAHHLQHIGQRVRAVCGARGLKSVEIQRIRG